MPSFIVRTPLYRWPSAPSECHQRYDQDQNPYGTNWAPSNMLTNLQQSTSKATKPETDRIRKEEDARQQAEADRIDDERLAAGPAASKKRKKEEARKLANVEAGRMNSGHATHAIA